MAAQQRQKQGQTPQLDEKALLEAYQTIARAAQQQAALFTAKGQGTVQLYGRNALSDALSQAAQAQGDALEAYGRRRTAQQQQRVSQQAVQNMQDQKQRFDRDLQSDQARQRIEFARAQAIQQAAQQQQRAEMNARQDEEALQLQNALRELQVFGRVVSARTAQTLGVPVGTLSYASEQARQKLAESNAKSSSKSSGKSSKKKKSSGKKTATPTGRLTAASELTRRYVGARYE